MRLFVAVDPGEQVRRTLTPRLDEWHRRWDLRWVRPENLHITLRFLGDWPSARREDLDAALFEAVWKQRAFSVGWGGFGVFPDWRRPRVLFLQLDDGGALADLAGRVTGHIDERCPDVGAAAGEFRAHVTLARFRDRTDGSATADLRRLAPPEIPDFTVDDVKLMASELRPDGPRYDVLGVFPLATG